VKHWHKSTRNIPWPDECANANNHSPRWHRPPLEGESIGAATNGHTCSSSRQSLPQKLVASPNKSHALVTISIKSEYPGSSKTTACICLADMSCHTNDVNGHGHQTDKSGSQADGLRGWMDTLNASNNAETARLGFGDGAETYLGARDVKCNINKMDSVGGHADVLNGQADSLYTANEMATPENALQSASTPQNKPKLPDSPVKTAWQCSDEPNTSSHHPGTLNMHTHVITPADKVGNISMHPIKVKPPDSLLGPQHHTQM